MFAGEVPRSEGVNWSELQVGAGIASLIGFVTVIGVEALRSPKQEFRPSTAVLGQVTFNNGTIVHDGRGLGSSGSSVDYRRRNLGGSTFSTS
jgi:hypothetical protein